MKTKYYTIDNSQSNTQCNGWNIDQSGCEEFHVHHSLVCDIFNPYFVRSDEKEWNTTANEHKTPYIVLSKVM